MKYYWIIDHKFVGPYAPPEAKDLFGKMPEGTTVCPETLDPKIPKNWGSLSSLLEFADPWKVPDLKTEETEPLLNARRARILATDDDSSMRSLLWEILSANGHELEFAVDGNDAYLKIRAKKYDLVILDVNMPKLNGYKLSRRLVAEYKNNRPKILIYTARDLEKEKYQFIESGADEILSKTANIQEIEKTINRLLQLKLETTSNTLAENYMDEVSQNIQIDTQQISSITNSSRMFKEPPVQARKLPPPSPTPFAETSGKQHTGAISPPVAAQKPAALPDELKDALKQKSVLNGTPPPSNAAPQPPVSIISALANPEDKSRSFGGPAECYIPNAPEKDAGPVPNGRDKTIADLAQSINNNPVAPQIDRIAGMLAGLETVQKRHSAYLRLLGLAFLFILGLFIFLILKIP